MAGVTLTHSQAVLRLKDIYDELERIQRKGNEAALTPEDEKLFGTLSEEFRQVDEHRKGLERKSAFEKVRQVREAFRRPGSADIRIESGSSGVRDNDYDLDPYAEPDSIEECRFRNPWDLSEVRTFGRSPEEVSTELQSRALSAIEKMPGCTDKIRSAATKIIEEFDDEESRISKICLATSSPEYMRAWTKVIRGRATGLTSEEHTALDRAMSLTDSAGGYMVPFQLDPTVIITSSGSRNDIRRIARTVIATSDIWNGVSSGEASWSWDSEGTQASDDAPTFAGPAIPNYKGSGFIPISLEALADAANVTGEIARILARGKDTLEAEGFATGSGGTQPTGIVTALIASSPSVIQASATTDTFAITDVYAVEGLLPERHQENASWLANRRVYNLVRQFDTAGGAGMWERIGNGMPPELLGHGAYRAEAMDGTLNASAENYFMVYGDFENYVITDRIGFQVEPIQHLFGANNRPTGQRGFYAYYRTGADSVDDGAFVLLNVT